MATYTLSDSVKCLDGVDYEVVKHSPHFEWVVEYEKIIRELCVAIFENYSVNGDVELQMAVSHLDKFQENLNTKMDDLVKQLADKKDVNVAAKTFAAEWAEAAKYQSSLKYHYIGGGPTAQKIRWGFQSTIKYLTICSTHLATKDDGIEFKKFVSDFVKNEIIQNLIDEMKNVQRELEKLKNSS